jgi:hypothetical protein
MATVKYLLIFGCNGVKLSMSFDNIHGAYEYILNQKLEHGYYELFKAERIISEDV